MNEKGNDNGLTFLFSIRAADESEADLKLRLEALNSRIENLTDRVKWSKTFPGYYGPEVPILEMLLRLEPSREECETLGKALLRAGELTDERRSFQRQLHLIELVKEDPNRMQALFGDFSSTDLDPDMFE